MSQQHVQAGTVDAVMERVMQDARLERFLEEEVVESYTAPSGGMGLNLGPLVPVLQVLLIGLLVAALVFALFKWRGRRGGARTEAEVAQEDLRLARERWVLAQLEAARAAEARDDWHAALRAYWGALVVGLGQSRVLAFRPGWTCREMLARTLSEGAPVAPVAALLPRVEAMEFGHAAVGPGVVGEVADLCRELLDARFWTGARA